MADQFFMSQKGYDEAVARLKYLKVEKMPAVVARIQEARSHGDLSENAEYDAARNEQTAVDMEITELEYKVKNAVIVEADTDASYVHIGSFVKVYDDAFDEVAEYEITGSIEADFTKGKISNESPVGAALMGHKVGDTVEVNAPDGVYTLRILGISVR